MPSGAALQIAQPNINPVGYFNASQAQAQQEQAMALEQKKQGLQGLYMMSAGMLRGNLDGQADAAEWEQGLDMLQQQGVDPKMLEQMRGKPQLANIMAKGSAEALRYSMDERMLDMEMQKLELALQKAATEASAGPTPTDDMREYDMAVAQGFAGTFMDFKKAQRATNNLMIRQNADGTTEIVQGEGTLPPRLTEGQSKDTGFYWRGKGANDSLIANEDKLTDLYQQGANQIPVAGNYLTSDEFKAANRDAAEFLAVILRKDTGAAVTPKEFEMYGPMYLPRPGDTKEQIDRLRAARERALEAVRAGVGPGEIILQEMERQRAEGGEPEAVGAPEDDTIYDAADFF